jgi:lipid II:glycine glycyltransferase (peptidoglycan interpeptide bridge formation enzyme)
MLVMIAEKDGEPLAGVVLLRNRYFCHYWLGAGKKSAENLGQGEILQWEAIKWAKQMGCQYYDMCVVESERLPNIARFKMGFSRTTVPFYCITRKRLGYRLGLRIQNAFG